MSDLLYLVEVRRHREGFWEPHRPFVTEHAAREHLSNLLRTCPTWLVRVVPFARVGDY